MIPTKRCDLCELALEFEHDGKRLEFAAHTPELCRAGTLRRIQELQQAIKWRGEAFERAVADCRRQIDEWCNERGYTSLTEHTAQMKRRILEQLAAIADNHG